MTIDCEARRASGRFLGSRSGPRRDGLAVCPGAPVGDTSILGWVVMGLKSAKEVGIPIPGEPAVRRGTLLWLDKVATGYVQGPGPLSALGAGHADHDRRGLGLPPVPGSRRARAVEFRGGRVPACGMTRIAARRTSTTGITRLSPSTSTVANPGRSGTPRSATRSSACNPSPGHQTGSWEPDTSLYGAKGGRIYCTALAALSLEVYYRYLRLYDEPKIPLEAGAAPIGRPGRSRRRSCERE